MLACAHLSPLTYAQNIELINRYKVEVAKCWEHFLKINVSAAGPEIVTQWWKALAVLTEGLCSALVLTLWLTTFGRFDSCGIQFQALASKTHIHIIYIS